MEIVLQSVADNSYRTTRFAVHESKSKEECMEELKLWISEHPELMDIENNKKILKNTLNWEIP